MKIIARKHEVPTHIYHLYNLFGAGIVLYAIIMTIISIAAGWFYPTLIWWDIILALLLLTIGGIGVAFIWCNVKSKKRNDKRPDYLLVYDNGEFIFADGYRCKPTDIEDITCNRSRFLHKIYEHGRITVKTKDRCITYTYVEMVELAHTLIYECITEYKSTQKNNRL